MVPSSSPHHFLRSSSRESIKLLHIFFILHRQFYRHFQSVLFIEFKMDSIQLASRLFLFFLYSTRGQLQLVSLAKLCLPSNIFRGYVEIVRVGQEKRLCEMWYFYGQDSAIERLEIARAKCGNSVTFFLTKELYNNEKKHF